MNNRADRLISIAPSDMNKDPDWANVSLEEVVQAHKMREQKRSENMTPEGEASVRVHVRSAPNELVSSLDSVARMLGIRRSVLTKCLSHQVIDWYKRSLHTEELATLFEDVYFKIKVSGKYSPLRKQIDIPTFRFVSEEPLNMHITTIAWVLGDLGDLGRPIGASATSLFLVGLARSLTLLEHQDWDKGNIDTYFYPEYRNMELCIVDRFIDTKGLQTKYLMREDGDFNLAKLVKKVMEMTAQWD